MASLDKVFPGLKEEMKRGKETYEKNHTCPTCKESAVVVCNCKIQDMKCENGHRWHIKDGKVILGAGMH